MGNQELKRFLYRRNIKYLYHANTVATACTFLHTGGLLSRGAVDDLGLNQTPQETDELDKNLDVYYDIFFDSDDIHSRTKKLNYYGPVVFVYSINLLDELPENSIYITKDNPIRWKSEMKEEDKYFISIDELEELYFKGTFAQHLTVRHWKSPLPFDHLVKIILDNPQVDNTSYFNKAYDKINFLMHKQSVQASLEIRECPTDCNCVKQYQGYKEGFTYNKFKTQV